mmetsp:Transcript_85394/g.174148  ORF Transcript_85394/g.174148 Transcript_85394/m.174148 type:complete len:253 (-) Transcript_85394:2309-3067(-)
MLRHPEMLWKVSYTGFLVSFPLLVGFKCKPHFSKLRKSTRTTTSSLKYGAAGEASRNSLFFFAPSITHWEKLLVAFFSAEASFGSKSCISFRDPQWKVASKPMRSDARTLSPPRAEMVPAKLPSMAFFVATQCSFPAWSRVWKSTQADLKLLICRIPTPINFTVKLGPPKMLFSNFWWAFLAICSASSMPSYFNSNSISGSMVLQAAMEAKRSYRCLRLESAPVLSSSRWKDKLCSSSAASISRNDRSRSLS